MGPRSREVADIFSPRLSSRQKNSAMTIIFLLVLTLQREGEFRDDNG